MAKSKGEIQGDLGLGLPPTDRFMELLAKVGDGDLIMVPAFDDDDRSFTPGEIESIVRWGAARTLRPNAAAMACATNAGAIDSRVGPWPAHS